MDPSVEFAFGEIFRKLDELKARMERRWAAPDVRSAAIASHIGGFEQSGAMLLVKADNWGGEFDEIPALDTTSTSSSPTPGEQHALDGHIVADNWGGEFEGIPTLSHDAFSALDPAASDSTSIVASATEEIELEAIPHQIQKLEELPDTDIATFDMALSNRDAEIGCDSFGYLTPIASSAVKGIEPVENLLQIQEHKEQLEVVVADEKVLQSTVSEALKADGSALDCNCHGQGALSTPPPPRRALCRFGRPRRLPLRRPRPRRRRRWRAPLRPLRLHRQWRALLRPRRVPPRRRGRPPRLLARVRGRRPRLRADTRAPERGAVLRRGRVGPCSTTAEHCANPCRSERVSALLLLDVGCRECAVGSLLSVRVGVWSLVASATPRASPTGCSTLGRSHEAHVVIAGRNSGVNNFSIDVMAAYRIDYPAAFTRNFGAHGDPSVVIAFHPMFIWNATHVLPPEEFGIDESFGALPLRTPAPESDCDGTSVAWLERTCEVGPSADKLCLFPDLVDIEFIGSNSVHLAALGSIKELTLSVLLLGAQLNYAPATPVDPGDPPPTLLTRCSTPGGNHVACFPEEVPFVHTGIAPSYAVTSSKTSWQQDFAKQFTTGNLVTFTKLVMALDALLLQLRMFVELRSYYSVQESQPEHFSEEMKHVEAICKKHAEAIISDFRFPFLGIQFLIRSLVAHVGTNIAHGFKIIVVVFLSDGHQVQSHKFSFGSDHDSAAMHAISEFPRGTFTVVDVECSIQDESAHCICGLRSVAVKEMQLGTEYHGMLLTFIKSDGCTCQVAGNGLWVHSVDSDYGPSVVPSSRVPLAWDPGGMEQIIYSWSLFFEWYLAISRELISSNQWTCKCSAIFLELPWLFCRDGFFSVSNVSNEQTGLLVTSYMLTSRCFELQPWPSPAMERHDKEKEIASGFTVFLYLSHTSTYSTMATTHIISVDWKIQKRMSSTHVCCHDGLLFIIRELQVPWDPGGSAMSPLAWGQAAIQEGGNARYYFILRCRIMLLALLHAYYIKLN